MILNDIIHVINDQKENLAKKEEGLIRTTLETLPNLKTHALIISGVRRCGKSTLVYQLIKNKLPEALYLNFEDPRLYEFELRDFSRLDAYIKEQKITVLAFDEIQAIPQWERYVRLKVDEKCQIIITGSNASLLRRELGSKLTGRHISKELFPFSYHEFCEFNGYKKTKASVIKYMEKGGFPEYVITGQQEILTQLFNDIIVRDIAARHGIRDLRGLQRLAVYLITNIGKLVSATKLKSAIGVSATSTVTEYLSFLQDTYLLFLVQKFSYSLKAQLVNPRKVYAIDTGLVNSNSLSFSDDHGRKFENMIYLHLRRCYNEIHYFSEKGECDFVISEKGKITRCIQACYDLHEDNADRELNGLFEALTFFKLKKGTLVTHDQKDRFEKNGLVIHLVPVYEFMD